MSNVVGRGVSNQKPRDHHNVIGVQQNGPLGGFSLPIVPQNAEFRPDYNMQAGARMVPHQYAQPMYANPPADYRQAPQFYQQQSQQIQQPSYAFGQFQSYPPQGYVQQQPAFIDPSAQYQQPPSVPPVEQQKPKREKKILAIIDPTTQEKLVFPPAQEKATVQEKQSTADAVDPAELVERKAQTTRGFFEKVKNELFNKESGKAADTNNHTEAAASAPIVPEKVADPVVTKTVAPAPTTVKADVPVAQEPAPAVEEVPAVEHSNKNVQFENEHTSPAKDDLDFESPPPNVPAAPATPIESSPDSKNLSKEDSKDEVEPDDKFEEAPAAPRETPLQSVESVDVVEKTPEELAKEEADKAAAEAERKRLREIELDAKIEECLQSDSVDVAKGVYGRDFMVAVRCIGREFQRTPCPLSPAQLADFGLDINSMSKNDKKPNFTPTWVQQNKSRPGNGYRGRMTTDGTGRGGNRQDRGMHNKKAPIGRPSIERVPRLTLPSSKDAWKPERQKVSDGTVEDAEKAKIVEVCRKVRALMNKITPTSRDDLTKEFIGYNVSSNDEQLSNVVDIIFDKAVEEPKFCALYAEVCKSQVDHEIEINAKKADNKKSSAFRNKILIKTQSTFQDKTLEINAEKLAAIENELDQTKKAIMKAEVLEEQTKFRRRKFGNMTFIGHLYRNHLLSTKIVQSCIFELFGTIIPKAGEKLKNENIDEESVQCALQLIETLGSIIDKAKDSSTTFLDQWFTKLEDAKPFCGNKIRFMIMNVIELRKNKWVPRKSVETGPKKIDEIHKDIRNEQLENEKARDQYERRHGGGGIRTNSNSLKKQGPTSRNSIERNKSYQHPEQKRAAAVVATRLTASNVQPKNITLSQLDNVSLGKSKREWHSGASGGGNTTNSAAPEPQKNAWVRRDSNDQRKKSNVDERQSALAAAKEINAGPLSSRRSTSQNSIADKEETLSEEQLVLRSKIMNTVHSDVKEYVAGDLSAKEMVEGFFDMVGKEKYAEPTLSSVYEMTIRAVTEKGMKLEERISLARALRQSLTDKKNKQAFIEGVTQFCKYAVDVELWCDSPNVWTNTGEILMNASHVPHDLLADLKIETLSIADLEPVFLAAKTSVEKKKFELFIDVLRRLTESEMAEMKQETAEGINWEFQELKFRQEMEKEGLTEEMEKCITSVGKSLKQLLCK